MIIIGGKYFVKCAKEYYGEYNDKRVCNYLVALDKIISFHKGEVRTEMDVFVNKDEDILKHIGKYTQDEKVKLEK